MAKVPVQIIVQALDKTAPAMNALTARVRALNARVAKLNPLAGLTRALGDSAFGKAVSRFGRALGMQAIQGGITKVHTQFKEFAGTLPGLATRLLGLGVAGAGIGYHLVSGAADSGEALGRLAKQAGTTVDYYASTQFAAEQSGVSNEVYAKSLAKLAKGMGEMTVGAGGPMLAFLQQISPNLARQVKGAKSTEEAMGLLGQAFEKIESPQKRALLSSKLWGEEAVSMGEFLHQGVGPIDEYRKTFMRLMGGQEALTKNAAAFKRSMGETSLAFTGLRNAAAAQLLPALTQLAATLTGFISAHRDDIARWAEKAAAAFQKWVESGGLERLVDGISKVATAAVWLAEKLGPTGTALAGLASLSPSTAVSLLSLGGTILRLATTVLPMLASGFMAVAPAVWGALAPVLPFVAAGAALALLGKTIYDNWDELAFIFKDWGNSLRWAIIDTWPKIRPILEKLSGFLGPIMGGGFKAALAVGDATVAKLTPEAAAAAAPAAVQSNTRVQVDFSNLPRGARVATESNADAVDTSLGYSSMVPDA